MTQPIVLPNRLPSSAFEELIGLLRAAPGPEIQIDGRQVRNIGARAAELLLKFKRKTEAEDGVVVIDPSEDMRDDLRLLGLEDALLEKDTVS